MMPEPMKTSIGKSKEELLDIAKVSFLDTKYTAASANKTPIILIGPSSSLYIKTPNNTGSTKDILVATEATETPNLWEVAAIRLKTIINNSPNANVPQNHGFEGISVMLISP